MIRRTSSSVIVVRWVGWGAKGAEPLTIARAMELSVRTCRPDRSATLRAHLLLGAFVERHETHRAGRQPPLRQQMTRSFGQHSGFAGSSRSDHPRRASGMRDGGQLILRQFCGRLVRSEGHERAVFERNAMHHRDAVDGRGEADRPAVEPHGRSVGKHNVACHIVLGRNGTEGDSCGQSDAKPIDCRLARRPNSTTPDDAVRNART